MLFTLAIPARWVRSISSVIESPRGNCGMKRDSGSDRASFFSSISRPSATSVSGLLSDAMRNTCTGPFRTPSSTFAQP